MKTVKREIGGYEVTGIPAWLDTVEKSYELAELEIGTYEGLKLAIHVAIVRDEGHCDPNEAFLAVPYNWSSNSYYS